MSLTFVTGTQNRIGDHLAVVLSNIAGVVTMAIWIYVAENLGVM